MGVRGGISLEIYRDSGLEYKRGEEARPLSLEDSYRDTCKQGEGEIWLCHFEAGC